MIEANQSVIKFEDIAVRYRVPRGGVSGIKEFTIRLLQRRIQYEEFWALRGVSFQVSSGEVFGIIGRNGAGKSTMLKVMARVLHPTRGRVVMQGHTAPLLELGGGFHPELTGRENIFLNMALLGFTHKQIDDLFDSIVEFSEIPEFIEAPLRTYSTGMVARLGFSVATSVRPEILLVDEVLSVGDAQFQQKCLDRMEAFRQGGTTIVIVSHSLGTVQSFCDRVLWLDHGEVQAIGEVGEVIEKYIQMDLTHLVPTEISSRSKQERYVELDPEQQVYSAKEIFSPEAGTVITWVRLNRTNRSSTAILFHSDDSRYVLYTQVSFDRESYHPYYQITARAGGNQRPPGEKAGSFPEVSVPFFMNESLIEQWVQVVMTWEGHPDGKVHLYLDGKLVGEREYSSAYSNDQPLPKSLSVGMRPLSWPGERVLQKDGTYLILHPESTNSIYDAQLSMENVRLYGKALDAQAINDNYRERHQQSSPLTAK
jgi:ABC-2 type transport system ATP-binding protein